MKFTALTLLNHKQRLQRLRFFAFLFSSCLLLPLMGILYWGYVQLEKNTLDSFRQDANSLVVSTNRKFFKKLTLSNNLAVDDFNYYKSIYNPIEQQVQQSVSPLATLDLNALEASRNIKGLVGFFQFDESKTFNSPVWPLPILDANNGERNKLLDKNLSERRDLAFKLFDIASQSEKITDKLDKGLESGDGLFKIIFDLPEYLIFYRVVTVQNVNKLQGYVVEREPYFHQSFIELLEKQRFSGSVLVTLYERNNFAEPLHIHVDGELNEVSRIDASSEQIQALQAVSIANTKLFFPLSRYDLSVSTGELPVTDITTYYSFFALVVIIALTGACFGFYRLGVSQLKLAEQRLNFVSSVSHELKTPLTSIRMYSEMLRDGSVPSVQFKRDYYDFIFNESERLTRLINNILQLSNLRNQPFSVTPSYIQLTELVDIIRSKVDSLIKDNGFRLNIELNLHSLNKVSVLADTDAMSQIAINITDNAIKFSNKVGAEDDSRKVLDLIVRHNPANQSEIQFEFRDYGEGITEEQQTKLFDLFYRGGSELTRTTQGTGIGLALVKALMLAQQGEVDVIRKTPGLALLLTFKAKT